MKFLKNPWAVVLAVPGCWVLSGCSPRPPAPEAPSSETVVVAPRANHPAPPAPAAPPASPSTPASPSAPAPVPKPAAPAPVNEKPTLSAAQKKETGGEKKASKPAPAKPMPPPPPFSTPKASPSGASHSEPKPSAGGTIPVQGVVKEVTQAPRPGSVPYKDALVAVHLTDVRAERGNLPKDVVVYLWGMKENRLTPVSKLRAGQTLSLSLQPWEDVEERYGGYNRVELTDPDALTLDPYWGELK